MIETTKMLEYSIYFLLPFLAGLTVLFIGVATYRIYYIKKITNPTFSPILKGREKELHQLVQQILTGQSSAIIGAFGNERTAVLDALRNQELYGDYAKQLVFSFLDISALEKECTQAQFWEYALEPLQEKIANDTDSSLFKAYELSRENDFNNRYLDKFIAQMKQEDLRLVLLINWFDMLLKRPQLKDEEFFGGLRVLASSHNPSPLCVIIASNDPIWQFHENIKNFNFDSPYLNFLEAGAVTLGVIEEAGIDKLLDNSGYSFTDDDKYFLKDISGNHPYLLQLATNILIRSYANKEENPIESTRIVLSDNVEEMLTNIFKFWSTNLRETFISVAQKIDVSKFRREVKELNRQGFIKQENEQWQINSSIFANLLQDKTVLLKGFPKLFSKLSDPQQIRVCELRHL